ncbi:membrane protein [Burkholderia aenigmatica]|uniref:Membrane protein n=1 Tax=Burkholderia aenigmatica TaxID=2015348 RepID=A0A6J5JK89_9BURK|nr:membrane protein [Burkholderia aenigmatica]
MTNTHAAERAGDGRGRTMARPAAGDTGPDPRVFGVAVVAAFALAAMATLAQHASMAAMGGEPMPGGWMTSAAWQRPCGWGAGRTFAAFAGMWGAMTATMMLPVLAPVLWRYRQGIGPQAAARSAWLVVVAGAGYFAVWMVLGALVFPAGAALMSAAARLPALARAMPFVAGTVVLAAGALQFFGWKARRLACCRPAATCVHRPRVDAGTAWRYGVRAAMRCGMCCGNLMAVALAAGMMDLRVMAAVTLAIAAERLVPVGGRVARIVGCVAVGGGVAMIVRAAGLL